MDRDELRELIRETVQETMTRMGIEAEDPLGMQRDFQWLRDLRQTTERVRRRGILAAVALVVAAALGAMWLGIQEIVS